MSFTAGGIPVAALCRDAEFKVLLTEAIIGKKVLWKTNTIVGKAMATMTTTIVNVLLSTAIIFFNKRVRRYLILL